MLPDKALDSWWAYEVLLLRRALQNPYWSSKWHGFLGAPLALAAAGIAWEEVRSWWFFGGVLLSFYLAILLVILIRGPYIHAKEVEKQARRALERIRLLESEIRVPKVQQNRLLHAKHLAGLIEAKLTGPLALQGLQHDLSQLATAAGYLAEYPAGGAATEFLRCVDVYSYIEGVGFDIPGQPASEQDRATASQALRDARKTLERACDSVLLALESGDAAGGRR